MRSTKDTSANDNRCKHCKGNLNDRMQKCRMNFNTMELEVLIEEVNMHSLKQRHKKQHQEKLRENIDIYRRTKRGFKKNLQIKQAGGAG